MRPLLVALVVLAACGSVTQDPPSSSGGTNGAPGGMNGSTGGVSGAGRGGELAGGRPAGGAGDAALGGTAGAAGAGGAGGAACIDAYTANATFQACGTDPASTCYSRCTLDGAAYVGCVAAGAVTYLCVPSCSSCSR